jgi:poly(3-hydroxybutyrate) depolymerase
MLAEQWAQLSKVTTKPTISKQSGYIITRWQKDDEKVQVELVEVLKRDHGIMVNPQVKNGGEAADYLLESPLSTAKHVIDFWQL